MHISYTNFRPTFCFLARQFLCLIVYIDSYYGTILIICIQIYQWCLLPREFSADHQSYKILVFVYCHNPNIFSFTSYGLNSSILKTTWLTYSELLSFVMLAIPRIGKQLSSESLPSGSSARYRNTSNVTHAVSESGEIDLIKICKFKSSNSRIDFLPNLIIIQKTQNSVHQEFKFKLILLFCSFSALFFKHYQIKDSK